MEPNPPIPMRLNISGAVTPGATLAAVLLIGHPMESGYRTLDSGQRVPKNVIQNVRVQLNGQLLFEAETGIGVSAHPYLAFPVPVPVVIPASGLVLSAQWLDDKGQRGEIQRVLK
jgi:sulfur-oxidizing protein SoxZ